MAFFPSMSSPDDDGLDLKNVGDGLYSANSAYGQSFSFFSTASTEKDAYHRGYEDGRRETKRDSGRGESK